MEAEKKNKFYISDYPLYRRIKEYMKDSNDPEKINKDDMVDDLRLKFKEYGRRQKCAFRALVIRTYKIALESFNSDEPDPDNESIDDKSGDEPEKNDQEDALDSTTGKSKVDKPVDSDATLDSDDPSQKESETTKLSANESVENGEKSDDNIGKSDDNIEKSTGNEDQSGVDVEKLNDDVMDEIDMGDESSDEDEDDIELQGARRLQARVSYMQALQNMTNSANKIHSSNIQVISSDEDDEEPSFIQKAKNTYPNFFKNGPVNIQRIDPYKSKKHKSPMKQPHTLTIHEIPYQPSQSSSKKRRYEGGELPASKRMKSINVGSVPNASFKMFGGFSKILQTVSELVVHVREAKIYETLGVKPPRGFILHGPPGCGKSLLAQAISGELEVPMIKVAGPELVAGVSGESESRIRDLFDSALEQAPCIVFIDELDAICPPRETARREMERRIVAQLLTCIDGLSEAEAGSKVVIIGATNRLDAIDPALRRAGRFDREVCLGIPDREARREILQVITENMKLNPGLDIDFLAAGTPGFVGADLKALASEAAIAAVNRCLEAGIKKIEENTIVIPEDTSEKKTSNEDDQNGGTEDKKTDDDELTPMEVTLNGGEGCDSEMIPDGSSDKTNFEKTNSEKSDSGPLRRRRKRKPDDPLLSLLKSRGPLLSDAQLDNLYIRMEDFQRALKSVQPSAKREGFATVPDVSWGDIGSLKDIRSELEKSIMMPVKYPEEFALLGISAPTGILLCGPPGCGKTLVAKAVANEANINFISVKGPELLNMYVGESERAVRQCFQRAKNSQPCVIFFDEIDALCPKRGASTEGSNATSRVVNQVLTEMDGVEGRNGVFLMAATNRPDMVDPAVLRPGRLDKILYVGLPSAPDRSDILRALTKNGSKPPMKEVDLEKIGADERLEGYTGADLAALIKEASLLAFTEYIKNKDEAQLCVTSDMIYSASSKIRPSVSPKEKLHYESLRILYGLPS